MNLRARYILGYARDILGKNSKIKKETLIQEINDLHEEVRTNGSYYNF